MSTKLWFTFSVVAALSSAIAIANGAQGDQPSPVIPTARVVTAQPQGPSNAPTNAPTELPPPAPPAQVTTTAPRVEPRPVAERLPDIGEADAPAIPNYLNEGQLKGDDWSALFDEKAELSADGKSIVIRFRDYSSSGLSCGNMLSFDSLDFRPAKNALTFRMKSNGQYADCREAFKRANGGNFPACERTSGGRSITICEQHERIIPLGNVRVPANLAKLDLMLVWTNSSNADEFKLLKENIVTHEMSSVRRYDEIVDRMKTRKIYDEKFEESARSIEKLFEPSHFEAAMKLAEKLKKEKEIKEASDRIEALRDETIADDSTLDRNMSEMITLAKDHPELKDKLHEASKEIAEKISEKAADEEKLRNAAKKVALASVPFDRLKKAGLADGEILQLKLQYDREKAVAFYQSGDLFSAMKAERALASEANKMYLQAYQLQMRACNQQGGRTFSLENCALANNRIDGIKESLGLVPNQGSGLNGSIGAGGSLGIGGSLGAGGALGNGGSPMQQPMMFANAGMGPSLGVGVGPSIGLGVMGIGSPGYAGMNPYAMNPFMNYGAMRPAMGYPMMGYPMMYPSNGSMLYPSYF